MNIKRTPLNMVYCWLIVFSVLPLTLIAIASVLSHDGVHLLKLPFTLENYAHLLNSAFARIAIRSINTALITTIICLLLAYPLSYLLTRSKHQSLLLILIIIPFWTSSLVRTYALLSILKFKGIVNVLLLKLHLIDAPITLLYSHFAVIGGLVYALFPFMVLPIFSNMERFDYRLIEAAQDLGASRWSIFFRVFLPNTKLGIQSGCLLVFLPAMTLFYISNILGGARSILLGNLIQNQFLVLQNWPEGAATSVLLSIGFIGLMLFYRRNPKELVN